MPNARICIPGIASLFVFATAALAAPLSFGGEDAVRAFLRNKLPEDAAFAAAFADLNADGRQGALVYVRSSDYCGSGGCPLYILENQGRTYRIVTRTTITRPPISVLRARTNGWLDIAVWVAGGGIRPGYEAVLRFNGTKYPSNPSLQPMRPGSSYSPKGVAIATDQPLKPL